MICSFAIIFSKEYKKAVSLTRNRCICLVPKAGLEPARVLARLILSQVRLPIPPLRRLSVPNARNEYYYTNYP